jgi:hypothetical protein
MISLISLSLDNKITWKFIINIIWQEEGSVDTEEEEGVVEAAMRQVCCKQQLTHYHLHAFLQQMQTECLLIQVIRCLLLPSWITLEGLCRIR